MFFACKISKQQMHRLSLDFTLRIAQGLISVKKNTLSCALHGPQVHSPTVCMYTPTYIAITFTQAWKLHM